MSAKGKRPMRALTAGDKIEAIQRVNDGESKASVARDIGVPESTLRGWCKNEDKLRYMSSRRSSPDTDKSEDGEGVPGKRARTESPGPPPPPASPPAGLDLSAASAPPAAPAPPPPDAPVELTTPRRASPAAPAPPPPPPARAARADHAASVSMSAISPLSGLAHLPGLAHSHLGLSFNEIATNLSLLAQLNPGLSPLPTPAPRALRSVRSPKPAAGAAAAALNLSEKHRSHRTHHHHAEQHASRAKQKDPVDDTLWYWLKTQQAMLDLTAQAARPLHLGKEPPRPAAPAPPAPAPAPAAAHLDYNRSSWIWQYYKQFGGAVPPPDELHRAAAQPRDKTENILYSHLVKGKEGEEGGGSPGAGGGGGGVENKEPAAPSERERHESARSQHKARTVLDSLLFHNNNNTWAAGALGAAGAQGAADAGAAEAADALAHGDKFLAWLEASGDPSVTRVHVHQLRSLLANLRARRPRAAAPAGPAPAPHAPAPLAHAPHAHAN